MDAALALKILEEIVRLSREYDINPADSLRKRIIFLRESLKTMDDDEKRSLN